MAKISINLATGSFQKEEIIVGIDLGTTNSLVAFINPEKNAQVINDTGKGLLVPSIVHFNSQGDAVVGNEAKDFLNHPILAKHLIEITQLLLTFKRKSIESLMGELDARKLCSSMTLFAQVEGANPVFQEVLDTFFSGYSDPLTMSILSTQLMSSAVAA